MAQNIAIDVGTVLELPPNAPRQYAASSPWVQYHGKPPIVFRAGEERKIRLEPFEVLTLDMEPK